MASAHAETTGAESSGESAESMVSITSHSDGMMLGDAPIDTVVEVEAVYSPALVLPRLELAVDEVVLPEICEDTSICIFPVQLMTDGSHTLEARLFDGEILEDSHAITVFVGEEGASSNSGSSGPADGADDGAGSKGCSVRAGGPAAPTTAAAFLLVAAGALGRRRRR